MKLLILHDHKFRKINGDFFSPGCFSNEILSWYTSLFDSVTIVGRIIEEYQINPKYSKIENKKVKILDKSGLKSLVLNNDAIIARLPSINGYIGLHYARKFKKKYFVEVVGCTFDAYWNYSLFGKIVAIPAYFLMKYNVKKADYVSYVTSNFLQKRYPNSHLCLSASDVQLDVKNDINQFAKIKGLDKSKIIIGTAAPIDIKYKGHQFMIEAIKLLKKENINIEYHLAGSGNKDRILKLAKKNNVEDNIVFDGLINHDRMNDWYDSLDIYVHPSLLEGMSRAILEAMSRGLPCIANDCGGNFEIINKQLLINKKKNISKQIAKKILNLLSESFYIRMSFYSINLINKDFDYKLINSKRKSFYHDYIKDLEKNK